jgi:hypothetical protein
LSWSENGFSIQIPTQIGEIKDLFNKFHLRINLVALLFGNLGTRSKTTFLEFRNLEILPKGLSIQNLKVEGLLRIVCNMWKVFTWPTCASDFFKSSRYVSIKTT